VIATFGVLVLGVIASPFYNWALQAGQSLLY
jgi:hypothetical protein